MMTRKKLPPYGRELSTRLRKGNPPSNGVWIYAGPDAWERAKEVFWLLTSRAPLVLPDNEPAERYRWPVRDLDVVVIVSPGPPEQTLEDLGIELIRSGAKRAVFIGDGTTAAFGECVFFERLKPSEAA